MRTVEALAAQLVALSTSFRVFAHPVLLASPGRLVHAPVLLAVQCRLFALQQAQ